MTQLLGIYLVDSILHRDPWKSMYIEYKFTKARKWKQGKCLSMKWTWWMKNSKMGNTYTIQIYSAVKKNYMFRKIDETEKHQGRSPNGPPPKKKNTMLSLILDPSFWLSIWATVGEHVCVKHRKLKRDQEERKDALKEGEWQMWYECGRGAELNAVRDERREREKRMKEKREESQPKLAMHDQAIMRSDIDKLIKNNCICMCVWYACVHSHSYAYWHKWLGM